MLYIVSRLVLLAPSLSLFSLCEMTLQCLTLVRQLAITGDIYYYMVGQINKSALIYKYIGPFRVKGNRAELSSVESKCQISTALAI